MDKNIKQSSLQNIDDIYIQENKIALNEAKNKIWQDIESTQNKSVHKTKYFTITKYAAVLVLGLGLGYAFSILEGSDNHTINLANTKDPVADTGYTTAKKMSDSTNYQIANTETQTTSVQQIKTTKKHPTIHTINKTDLVIIKPNNGSEEYKVQNLEIKDDISIVNNNESLKPTPQKETEFKPRVMHINEVYTPSNSTAGHSQDMLYRIHKNAGASHQDHQFNIKFNKF